MSADVKSVVVWRRPPKSGTRTPLVIFLHGRGADENDLIDISERLPRAFAYASVRAPLPLEWGGYTWFENRTPPRPPATLAAGGHGPDCALRGSKAPQDASGRAE